MYGRKRERKENFVTRDGCPCQEILGLVIPAVVGRYFWWGWVGQEGRNELGRGDLLDLRDFT